MDLFHPNLRLFGRLELLEVYDYYDAPVFVSCQTPSGSLYLAVSVAASEQSERWLYLEVSRERFTQVRSGGLDLHTAFSQPENGVSYLVDVPHDEDVDATVRPLTSADLTDEILPARGEVLTLPTATLPRFEKVEHWAARALRDVVGFELKLPEFLRSEAPSKMLGAFLTGVQDTVNAIAQARRGSQSRRGTLAKDVLLMNELAVVAAGSGSFSIVLASTAQPSLFVESTPSEASLALEEFLGLLSASGHAEELQQRLAEQPRVASNFLSMLRALHDRVESVNVEWSSPQPDRHARATLPAVTVDAAIAVIEHQAPRERREFIVLCRLVGANIDKKSFEVWAIEREGDRFSGRIADEALESVNGAIIGNSYRALIVQVEVLKPATGDVQEETTLLQLLAAS